jgi:DNA-binding transcriptional ArsR family regulator
MVVKLLRCLTRQVEEFASRSAPDLASLAKALADHSRAAMVLCLLDGRAWTASELAGAAHVSRGTATSHLDLLVNAGILTELRQGRHRYVRLADNDTAEVVESLAALAARHERILPAAQTYRAQRADASLRVARSCYRHLAGHLGVAVSDGLKAADLVSPRWELTEDGRRWLDRLGISIPERTTRPVVRPCLDWTERREHCAGVAADALLTHCLQSGAIVPSGAPRALRLTSHGRKMLAPLLDAWTPPGEWQVA